MHAIARHSHHISQYKPQHISRFSVQPPRSLHQFKRPEEVLRAVRDAISAHGHHYMSTGAIHGGINVDTICIGAPPSAPHLHGFLIEPSARTDDPTFKSFQSLSGIISRKQNFPIDYLDELESFYYVLSWMCYAYGGGVDGKPCFTPAYRRSSPLTRWAANPTSREAILEKEAMLFGNGIRYSQAPLVSDFWGGETYQELLDNLHYVVRSRYIAKTELGRPRTMAELRLDAGEDYEACLGIINTTLFKLERRVRS